MWHFACQAVVLRGSAEQQLIKSVRHPPHSWVLSFTDPVYLVTTCSTCPPPHLSLCQYCLRAQSHSAILEWPQNTPTPVKWPQFHLNYRVQIVIGHLVRRRGTISLRIQGSHPSVGKCDMSFVITVITRMAKVTFLVKITKGMFQITAQIK